MTEILIGCPNHYLNVMNSVIILKMGWMNTIGLIFYTHSGYLVDILDYYFTEYTLGCLLLGYKLT